MPGPPTPFALARKKSAREPHPPPAIGQHAPRDCRPQDQKHKQPLPGRPANPVRHRDLAQASGHQALDRFSNALHAPRLTPPHSPFARGKVGDSRLFPPLRRGDTGGFFECLRIAPGSSSRRLKTALNRFGSNISAQRTMPALYFEVYSRMATSGQWNCARQDSSCRKLLRRHDMACLTTVSQASIS